MEHTIDATNQSLGRVASQAAAFLMGKNSTGFSRNKLSGAKVHITNVSKAKITEKKKQEKKYEHYSGYPGGLRYESLEEVITKKGVSEAFRRAVEGMLPRNKLKKGMLKNLKVTE